MSNTIDILLTKILQCGTLRFQPFIVTASGERILPCYETAHDDAHQTIRLCAEHNGLFRDCLYIEYADGEMTCRRTFENLSGNELKIREMGVELSGVTFGENPRDDYFYHNENPRIYQVMTFPVDYCRTAEDAKDSNFDIQAGNRWADPGVVSERIGASPYQPFPAFLLSNYHAGYGIVHGTISQEIFYHNYLARHDGGTVTADILSSFKSVDVLEMEPGRILVDEWYLGRTDAADDIEKIFERYTDVLRRKLPVGYGRTDINRTTMVWGSWNDGLFRNISEDLILTEAAFLRDNFPTVRWIQLDDGYATMNNHGAHGLGVPYEGEEGVDCQKFPNGLRHYTDKLRELGMRPAIWIGGFCPKPSKIFQEHPEWFIDYSYRTPSTSPLDVSQQEARRYMEYAADVLIREYGFDGVKHDFWSYAFEDSHSLYKNKDRSGYEYRRWWLTALRNRLPKDGYLQTGCDLVEANPFLGEFFTNYRYGIDIGSGNWDNVKANFLWGAACFATHTGDLFPPNSDSIGLFPGLSEREAMFCINYCIATHSMVEIAGRLSQSKDRERLRILKKAACNPNNGQDVYFAGYDYRNHAAAAPEILYFKTPHFSRLEGTDALPLRTVALFNLEDHSKKYSLSLAELGLPDGEYIFTDVWSGEQYTVEKNGFLTALEPHASRMLAVSCADGIQLFDANIRINAVWVLAETNQIRLETDYRMEQAELRFHKIPKAVQFDGEKLAFQVEGDTVLLEVPGKGVLEISF